MGNHPEYAASLELRQKHREEIAKLMDAYKPAERLTEPPEDSSELRAIEVSFAIPVHVTHEQMRRLGELIDEITDAPWNEPREGVHWLAGQGSKPSYSKTDAAFLGKPVDPNAPDTGEPTFDNDVFYLETSARSFVSNKERERHMRSREAHG